MIHAPSIRRAVVAWLRTDPELAETYSSPPAAIRPPLVVCGEIAADAPMAKGGTAGWYNFAIECWAQTQSPLDLDRLAAAAWRKLQGASLADPDALLSPPQFVASADAFNPDAPGGPILSRTLTFRLLAQDPQT